MILSKTITHSIRGALVLLGIIVLTSISVDATDSFRSSESALSILARYVTTPGCPVGMVPFTAAGTSLCIDTFEDGVGETCAVSEPASPVDSATNANDADCLSVSKSGVTPWRQITQLQATQVCARAGKRLPTAFEWYTAAVGTPDGATNCNISGSLQPTGTETYCRSGVGAYDMIGNVWEFVSGDVLNAHFGTDVLPGSGFVHGVTPDGLPYATAEKPDVIYNNDYFWSDATGTYAVIRGGYYGSGSDGGIYSAHSDIEQRFSSGAVGFRCVSELAARH